MDLKFISGLPIKEENNQLFSEEMEVPEVDIRTIEQAQDVLLEKVSNPKELYYMYRGVAKHADKKILEEHNLRYDITVIPALTLGKEYNKTVGHYHPNVPGENISYPEIYEVLHGKAHYLLQKVNYENNPQEVLDILFVEAHHGDKIIIPPSYGHVTINPGPDTLVMANILEKNFESIYQPYVLAHGGVFYDTKEGIKKNKNYKNVPNPKIIKAKKYEGFGFSYNKPMYNSAVHIPGNFEFLTRPQKYLKEFEEYIELLKK